MDTESNNFTLILIVVFAVLAMKFLPRIIAGVPFVEADALKKMMDDGQDVVVLDVRSDREYGGRIGHISGAVHVPLSQLSGRVGSMKQELEAYKEEPIFIVCQNEKRSPGAARMLRKMGFTKISVLKGGMKAWSRRKLPVEGKA